MSCPDWRVLCRQRESDPGDAPEWRSALRHLDGCAACQTAAPAFDPTLLFRRLPALEVGSAGVEAMKQAVAGMRRGQTIEHRRRPLMRTASRGTWRQAAALAAVFLGSLLLRGADVGPEVRLHGTSPEALTADVAPASEAAATASEIDLWRMPLIETADPTYGSIIQADYDDMSLVLVMPSGIDV